MCVGVEVEIRLVGALEQVRGRLLDRRDRGRRAEHAGHADVRIELVLAVVRAQLTVGARGECTLREQRIEVRARQRALDERRGRADHRGVELMLDPARAPRGQRRDHERGLVAVDDRVGRGLVADRGERRDLRMGLHVATRGDRAEDRHLLREIERVGARLAQRQAADPPAVEVLRGRVREQRVVLDEERPLLRKLDLVLREVDERRIGVDLTEVGVDGRGHGEPGQRPQLRVEPGVEAAGPAMR